MPSFVINKGLDLPIEGAPEQEIDSTSVNSKFIAKVGLMCTDFPFLKPILEVKEGDEVKIGDPLFIDNKSQIKFTSIAGGEVKAINRGEKRRLISIEISLSKNEETRNFNRYSHDEVLRLASGDIKNQLIQSGMWTAFRTRPFSKIPDPKVSPRSIFVTAIDSNPLAPRPELIIARNKSFFKMGLDVIAGISGCPVHVCVSPVPPVPPYGAGGPYDERFKIPHGESSNVFFSFFFRQTSSRASRYAHPSH